MDATEILKLAAATNKQRNAKHNSCYKHFGNVLAALFPDGVLPPVKTKLEFNRLNVFIMCAGKLHRYAQNFATGGCQDSARDLQVYAAMLEEFTYECTRRRSDVRGRARRHDNAR